MKIAVLATNWFPVPSARGPEMVVYEVTQGLVRRGHEVTLFASGNSQTSARLVSVTPTDTFSDPDVGFSSRRRYFELALISKAYQMAEEFDLIHVGFSCGKLTLPFASFVKTPSVVTVHDELTHPFFKKLYPLYKDVDNFFFVSISDSQRKPLPELPWIKTVYNGVNLKDFEFREERGDYLVSLGRLSPTKGIHLAIEAARKAGVPLKIAGGDREIHPDYFEEQIAPAVDGKRVEFLGPILSKKKRSDFLKNARALLFPIQWEEPFGLVMVEAMACGTPVIAFNRGSIPEVVADGKTGFIVKTVGGMVRAIKKIDQINRRRCREWVEKSFSAEKMVDGYEEVYREILRRVKG